MFSKRGFSGLVIVGVMILASCTGYNRLLKSTDFELKYEKAVKYYNAGDYNKALPLLEELITIYKGTSKGEKVYYYYAYTNYALGDYILAGYHFGNFAKTFPTSDKAEECAYMYAYCYYLDSPDYNLDQTNTYKAIDQLQLFINKYPASDSLQRCNQLIDNLHEKLERKSYETAKLYYNLSDYKAAIQSMTDVMKDYPDSKYSEELSFLIVKSNYLLAEKSIESKKKERFSNTVNAYHNFVENFPDTKYSKEAENIYNSTLKELDKLNNT